MSKQKEVVANPLKVYEEWTVEHLQEHKQKEGKTETQHSFEKIRINRPKVKITPAEAETLNNMYATGDNKYHTLYLPADMKTKFTLEEIKY